MDLEAGNLLSGEVENDFFMRNDTRNYGCAAQHRACAEKLFSTTHVISLI